MLCTPHGGKSLGESACLIKVGIPFLLGSGFETLSEETTCFTYEAELTIIGLVIRYSTEAKQSVSQPEHNKYSKSNAQVAAQRIAYMAWLGLAFILSSLTYKEFLQNGSNHQLVPVSCGTLFKDSCSKQSNDEP
jgi:hypothetical protein